MATITYDVTTVQYDFQANTYTSGDQLAPDVVGLSNGGFVVAYNNFDIDDGFILLDFYDKDGNVVGTVTEPYFGTTEAVGAPTITEMSNGNVVVIWDENSADDHGLKGAIYSPEGETVVPEFEVTSYLGDTAPQVAALQGEDGGFVVVNQNGSGGDIYIEVFDENGVSQSSETQIDDVGSTGSEPVVTGLADGGFVVTWTDSSTSDTRLMARIFEADGTPREVNGSIEPFVVATGGDNSQPAITALPDGNWAIAYTDTGWANEDVGITLTIMGPNGEVVNAYEHANTPNSPNDPGGNESDPDITVLDNGYIVVSWTYPAKGTDPDIRYRIFDQDGDPITLENYSGEGPLDQSSYDEVMSAISGLQSGQFVAAWQDEGGDGSGDQITVTVKELVRTINGDGASQTLNGDDIRDVIYGNGGADTLNGFGGDDTLEGGAGDDTLNGGDGRDTASYAGATGGVTVSLATAGAQNTGGDGTDTLSSIENLIGSNFADTLSGTAGDNAISGGGNNDNIKGYSGNDVLNGDKGDDTLNGGANNDTLNGGENNDTLIGQDGNDILIGGNGIDTASYVGAVAGVTVALGTTTAQNTVGDGTDTLSSIENLIGSNFVDTLSGTSDKNTISGGGNNDDIKGYAGDDTLNGDNGNDTLNGGANNDTLNGGENNDTLIGQDGNDTLNGGNGADTASYVGAVDGVTVSLSVAGAQNTGGDGSDTLVSIENLIGSATGDTLSGSGAENALTGGGGDDTLIGYSGIDTLLGDAGDDTLNGGANNDTLNGGGNADTLIGQDGNDVLIGGGGADDFVFDDGHGADTVTDFQNGSDQFDLKAVGGVDEFADLAIIDNGATVTVNYGTGSFTIANLADPGQLDAGDFIFA